MSRGATLPVQTAPPARPRPPMVLPGAAAAPGRHEAEARSEAQRARQGAGRHTGRCADSTARVQLARLGAEVDGGEGDGAGGPTAEQCMMGVTRREGGTVAWQREGCRQLATLR
jgi:hypothetical protein